MSFSARKLAFSFYINFVIIVSLPFDWRTPIGFAITACICGWAGIQFTLLLLVLLLIYMGLGRIFTAMTSDIQCTLKELNSDIRIANESKDSINMLELKNKLNEAIKFHAESVR